jgi:hypothetical protein
VAAAKETAAKDGTALMSPLRRASDHDNTTAAYAAAEIHRRPIAASTATAKGTATTRSTR